MDTRDKIDIKSTHASGALLGYETVAFHFALIKPRTDADFLDSTHDVLTVF